MERLESARVPPFITDDFLLDTPEARALYHGYAEHEPILDYHTHLSAKEIAEDRRFATIADAWLESDHYKWRAMRANGIPEELITGSASPRAKFDAWAQTMPRLLGNPQYHWTHLELKRFFELDVLLGPDTADRVWEHCNARLRELSCRDMMRRMNVRVVCTTDDPADSLEHHHAIAADPACPARVYPTWRPDAALGVDDPERFNAWLQRLATTTNRTIRTFDDFWKALEHRHAEFHAAGCRLSDHGIESFEVLPATLEHAGLMFDRVRSGERVTGSSAGIYRSALLHAFAKMDAARGWVQQFHVGPLRNNSPRLMRTIGRDAGGDSMGDEPFARGMNAFFGRLDAEGVLAKTIVYNINPKDNAMVIAALGNFEDGSVPGKMQFGSAWWFNDHIEGMEGQLTCLARVGVLSRFVGMLTDSRSFLSFPRHEYFRRVLCNWLGREMHNGRLPGDPALAGGMVRDISYTNAANFFGFPK
jgi:glucuronate isomerase